VDATEDLAFFFHPMPDYSASAMRTAWRGCLYRAFKAVKDVTLTCENHFERFVIVISASLTISHLFLLIYSLIVREGTGAIRILDFLGAAL
jgi:hypothetical protein